MLILQITADSIHSLQENSNHDGAIIILVVVFSIIVTSLVFIIDNKSKKKKENVIAQSSVNNSGSSTFISGKIQKETNTLNKSHVLTKEKNQEKTNHIYDPISTSDQNTNNLLNNSVKTGYKKSIVKVNPRTTFISPEEEPRNQIKFIGYEPNDFFYQEESINYPYVIMPRPRSIIKFPRKNKVGIKGNTEDHFFGYIKKYFTFNFQIFNDRILIISTRQNPYEPDIAIIDEKNNINLFIDIEIDEPYDGISRVPLHYIGYDNERNNFFRNRGWLTIRFAEIQVWSHPESCCKFIYNVISSFDYKYKIPTNLQNFSNIEFMPQWSIEQALEWAKDNYRERYLRIERFVPQGTHKELETISYSDLENKIEDQVNETESNYTRSNHIKQNIVKQAINTGKYISGKYIEDICYTIFKPERMEGSIITCFCFLKNNIRNFDIKHLTDLIIRDQPYQVRINGEAGVNEVKRVVCDAIKNHKIIRMKYTRGAWTEQTIDKETGEIIILDQIEAEESIRTITNIDFAVNILDQEHIDRYNLDENYITAFCHKRGEQRTFRFDRINELEILNV